MPDDAPYRFGLSEAVSPLRLRGMVAMLSRIKRQVRLKSATGAASAAARQVSVILRLPGDQAGARDRARPARGERRRSTTWRTQLRSPSCAQ